MSTIPTPQPHSFNPHPARRPDATCHSASSVFHSGFNPHPARRPDGAAHPARRPDSVFQSSPGQKAATRDAGCNLRRAGWRPRSSVSILTRPEGRMQQCSGPRMALTGNYIVSILTRPEGRMQLVAAGFLDNLILVSILTRPEGRMQPTSLAETPLGTHVSILTRPEGRMQPEHGIEGHGDFVVSILTRPEGRMQLDKQAMRVPCDHVSILTRPEGRMQPGTTWSRSSTSRFQSSPGQKAGCNSRMLVTTRGS